MILPGSSVMAQFTFLIIAQRSQGCKKKVVGLMAIDVRAAHDATIVLLTGDMDASSCVGLWDIAATRGVGDPALLVLDLSGVERVYMSGMQLLLDVHTAMAARGGRLICCGARPFVREVMRITWSDRIVGMQVDVESALDAARVVS